LQHHQAPSCRSDLLYKGALQDRSRTVWRGMIKVDPIAQKTNAYQRNDNLMLSADARADSIPGLEIEADDVRCTHGSTVGRLDDNVLFYLQSRGLDRAAAESLLTYAFASEIVQAVGVNEVRERLERALISRLPRGELLRETA